MTRKPRPISGNEPYDAIAKDYNRYCGRIVGTAEEIFDRAFIVNLLTANNGRTTSRTVQALSSSDVVADGRSLLQVASSEIAATGARRVSEGVWSGVDANGTTIPSLNVAIFSTFYTMGDSITADGRYQSALEAINSNVTTFNVGVGGDRLDEMLDRFQVDVIDAGAESVFIMGGVNDLIQASTTPVSSMQTSITGMVNLCASNSIPCIVSNITPFGSHVSWTAEKQTWMDEYNSWLPGFLETTAAFFKDMNTVMVDPGTDDLLPAWSNDALHFNAIGYEVFGQVLSKVCVDLYTGISLSNYDGVVNKCACKKSNPTDLTGLTLTDDAGGAATLTLVDNQKMIEIAGLDKICTSFKMYKIDNSAGATTAKVDITGNTTNTNPHSIAIYATVTPDTGFVSIGTNSGAGLTNFQNMSTIQRISTENLTPTGGGNITRIQALAGATVWFVLPQLEESSISTPIVIGADTAASATRDADKNKIAVSSKHTIDSGAERGQFKPSRAGQINKYLRSFFIDATHTIDVYINATQVIAFYVDGVNTSSAAFNYTHLADIDFMYDVYWDQSLNQLGIRADAVSGDIDSKSFITGTFAGMTALPVMSGIGNKNDADQAQGEFANNGVPINWSSASQAGFV